MTAPEKPESTEQEEPRGVGLLPPAIRQQIELRRMANAVAVQLANLSWGQNIDGRTRSAIAEWGRRHQIDVTTEVDVLGNRLYLNSRYYLRRLAGLIEAGLVEYAYPDHVQVDPRLEKLGDLGTPEILRRTQERIAHGIPDEAKGGVVFRVKLRALEREVCGASWCGGGTRKSDPVGDQEPIKTAESRAARRAMRLLVSHVPQVVREVDAALASATVIESQIQEDHAKLDNQRPMEEYRHVHSGDYDDAPRLARGAPVAPGDANEDSAA